MDKEINEKCNRREEGRFDILVTELCIVNDICHHNTLSISRGTHKDGFGWVNRPEWLI